MKIVDCVLFKMPKDKEYQFPAMSVLHAWVASFAPKMKSNDASFGKAAWELEYDVEMNPEDWNFFARAGYKLPKEQTHPMSGLDMVVDMTDERISSFRDTKKHVFQICVAMSGLQVNATTLPFVRRIRPALSGKWVTNPSEELLLNAQDGDLTGVIGPAGRETFLAASMGVGIVELVPEGRPRNWLSKYANPLYRVIEPGAGTGAVNRAVVSIERLLIQAHEEHEKKAREDKLADSTTVR